MPDTTQPDTAQPTTDQPSLSQFAPRQSDAPQPSVTLQSPDVTPPPPATSQLPDNDVVMPSLVQPPIDSSPRLNQNQSSAPLLRNFEVANTQTKSMSSSPKLVLVLALVAVLAGIGTGYGGYRLQAKNGGGLTGTKQPLQQVATGTIKNGDVFGIEDSSTFKDSATGYLEIGGLEGEGSHHLLRPGGISQTVYLTSSVTDLDKFQGMEVKVGGETFKGQKAGWLMDVGRVEIIKVTGEKPADAPATSTNPKNAGGDE